MADNKRLYIKVLDDHVHVVFRPTHETILLGFLSKDKDLLKDIKGLLTADTEKFAEMLVKKGLSLKNKRSSNVKAFEETEEWYEKAWMYTTNNFIKEHKLPEVPEDGKEVITMSAMINTIKAKAEGKPLPKKVKPVKKATPVVEEKVAEPKPKPKPVAKPKAKAVTKKVEKAVPAYKTLDEAREAFAEGKITLDEYKVLRKTIK